MIPRFGVILGKDGGAFPQLLRGAKSGITFNLKALFVGDSILEKAGKFDFNKSFTLDAKAADLSMNKILSMHGVTAYPGHGQRFIVP